MKLLITTATAALLSAGVAFAEGDADTAAHSGAMDANAAAESKITSGGEASAHANMGAAAHAGMPAHDLADLDADASGDVSLTEAQAFDPSVTQTAFSEFDSNADGMLDEAEYGQWAAQMDMPTTGQGDVSLDAGDDAGITDFPDNVDATAGVENELGADADEQGPELPVE